MNQKLQEKINKIYQELKQDKNFILNPTLKKLGLVGKLLKKEKLHQLNSIKEWNKFKELETMFYDNYDNLEEIEKEEGLKEHNDTLIHWLSNKLANSIRDEIITRLKRV